jgi:hypothetical protein
MAVKQRRRVVENTIAQLREWNIVSGKYRCKNPESADVAQFLSKYIRIVSGFCESLPSEEAVEKTLNYPLHDKILHLFSSPSTCCRYFIPFLSLTCSTRWRCATTSRRSLSE